jgi:hypothetical protein
MKLVKVQSRSHRGSDTSCENWCRRSSETQSNSSRSLISLLTRKVGTEVKKNSLQQASYSGTYSRGTQSPPPGPFSCGWSEDPLLGGCGRSSLPPPHGISTAVVAPPLHNCLPAST